MPNLSSDYQEIPPNSTAYDYDNPSPPFSPKSIAAIDSIKAFLSENELAQARRLETVYFSPVFNGAGGTSIPGLRSYPTTFCLYLRRFDDRYYEDLLQGFLDAVYDGHPKASLGGVTWPWFRVTTPDRDRYYPLYFHGNLQAWTDRMIAVATELKTTMAWFDKGKFLITDRRKLSFGDLHIESLEGRKPIPQDW